MSQKNLYEILGVDKSTSCADIKKAFLKLAKTCHPDKGGDAETFKQMLMACDILSDENKRAQYDLTGVIPGDQPENGPQMHTMHPMGGMPFPFPFGGGGGGINGVPININHIFETIFEGSRARQQNPPQMKPQPSTNVNRGISKIFRHPGKPPARVEKLPLRLKHLYDGYIFTIHLDRTVFCKVCDGTGSKTQNTCNVCNGMGVHIRIIENGFMQMQHTSPCMNCNGSGVILADKCDTCTGEGKLHEKKNIEVNITPGLNNGDYVILSEACSELTEFDKAGDIHMVIELQDDEHGWKRTGNDGRNLEKELIINLSESLLGCTVELVGHPGYEDGLFIQIPAGSFEGDVYCLTGLGMPIKGNNLEYGDLIIRIRVRVKMEERKELATNGKELLKDIFQKSCRTTDTKGELVHTDMYLYRLSNMP